MENASKALIIAGGVLLAIMILSVAVYLVQNGGFLQSSYNQKLAQDEINGFNNKFLIYSNKINAQEMVSLINLVNENNIKNEFVPEKQIQLFIDGINVQNNPDDYQEDDKINMMNSTNIMVDGIYECKKIEYHPSGHIKIMKYET